MTSDATTPAFFGRVFTAEAEPGELTLDQLPGLRADDDVLVWIDLVAPSEEVLLQVWAGCGLPAEAKRFLGGGTMPEVAQQGSHLWVRCIVVDQPSNGKSWPAASWCA